MLEDFERIQCREGERQRFLDEMKHKLYEAEDEFGRKKLAVGLIVILTDQLATIGTDALPPTGLSQNYLPKDSEFKVIFDYFESVISPSIISFSTIYEEMCVINSS